MPSRVLDWGTSSTRSWMPRTDRSSPAGPYDPIDDRDQVTIDTDDIPDREESGEANAHARSRQRREERAPSRVLSDRPMYRRGLWPDRRSPFCHHHM